MRKNIKDSSIIIISHQERILKIADEIVVIANGRIKQQGVGDDVLPALTGTADAVLPCNKFTEVENG